MRPERIVLLSSVRNEGPYILEFVAHHLAVGFSEIHIAANDCSDGTVGLLKALDRAGFLRFQPNVVPPGERPQHAAYRQIREATDIDKADWLMVLDADEFLNVHIGDRTVQALVGAAPPGVDIIALNAGTFGSGGQTQWQPGPVTRRFLDRLPDAHRANGSVKTLIRRPADYGAIRNHTMLAYHGPKALLTIMRGDGALEEAPPDDRLWPLLRHIPAARVRLDLAQYNHYAIRTADDFRLRAARNRGVRPVGTPNDRHDAAYFALRDAADRRDTSILALAAATDAMIARMRADAAIDAAQIRVERMMRKRLAALAVTG